MSAKRVVIIDGEGRAFSNDLTSCEAWDTLLAYLADRGLTTEKLVESFNAAIPIEMDERIEEIQAATGLEFVADPRSVESEALLTQEVWEAARANVLKSVENMFAAVKYDDKGHVVNPLNVVWERTFVRTDAGELLPEQLVITITQKIPVKEDT